MTQQSRLRRRDVQDSHLGREQTGRDHPRAPSAVSGCTSSLAGRARGFIGTAASYVRSANRERAYSRLMGMPGMMTATTDNTTEAACRCASILVKPPAGHSSAPTMRLCGTRRRSRKPLPSRSRSRLTGGDARPVDVRGHDREEHQHRRAAPGDPGALRSAWRYFDAAALADRLAGRRPSQNAAAPLMRATGATYDAQPGRALCHFWWLVLSWAAVASSACGTTTICTSSS